MNETITLLKLIGSPFVVKDYNCDDMNNCNDMTEDDMLELYRFATKNKIGLLYLESIKNKNKLGELTYLYEKEMKRHELQLKTASRVSKILNKSLVDHAIFKSIMPFPATPNDIDIIHFGEKIDFDEAANIMLSSDYMEVKGEADTEQRMFHDVLYGGNLDPHPKNKDIYDIDIYQKLSASYIIYLDKHKIKKFVTEIDILGNNVKVLKPEAELLAIIIHSIIPEMLCTIYCYYAVVYHIAKMNVEDIDRFVTIVKENKVVSSVNANLSLVAELHNRAHGFIPDKIETILLELGKKSVDTNILIKNNFKMPHRYSLYTVAKILFEKSKENEFRKSLIKQIILMCNPRLAKWVVYNFVWRRKRETY